MGELLLGLGALAYIGAVLGLIVWAMRDGP